MAITFKNVASWMKKSNVKGFAVSAYPTVGKPYTFNLTHKVAGVGVDTYNATLRSDIVQKLPGSGSQPQAAALTFTRESLAATAASLHIQPYDGPEAA